MSVAAIEALHWERARDVDGMAVAPGDCAECGKRYPCPTVVLTRLAAVVVSSPATPAEEEDLYPCRACRMPTDSCEALGGNCCSDCGHAPALPATPTGLGDCENCGHFQDWLTDRTCTHCGWPDQERMRWRAEFDAIPALPATPNGQEGYEARAERLFDGFGTAAFPAPASPAETAEENARTPDEYRTKIRALLSEVYKPEGVDIWLSKGHLWLDGQVGDELIDAGEGERVLAAAERLVGGAW